MERGTTSFEVYRDALSVLHAYCSAIDRHAVNGLSEVFADDAMVVVGEDVLDGAAQIVPALTAMFDQRAWARHLVSNAEVSMSADGDVLVRAYFQFVLSGVDRIVGLGDYAAVMRTTDEALRIVRLEVAMLDVVTMPR